MNTVPRVFVYLRRYPWMAAATLACAILSTLMVIVFPAVTKRIIDEVLYQHRAERLTPLVLIAALAFVLQHGLNSVRIILNNTFEQKVIFDLRSDLYSHIQMLPLRWFDNRATGDLMTRILEDVNSVERMLIDGIEQGRGRAAGWWGARDRRTFREIYVTHVCHQKCSGVKSRMNVCNRRRNGQSLVYVIHV
jgi:ATP-binding cassette subfamily B protein